MIMKQAPQKPIPGAGPPPLCKDLVRRSLLAWYDRNARALPWRTAPSDFGTVVSEFMLQQTRVTTVLPYYERFLAAFPDFAALAAADADDVISLWSGLGYYRRARLLRDAARRITERHDGQLPSTADELSALPGFGPYTTAAVGSIARGLPLAVVDGNVRRVLSRLFMRAELKPADAGQLALDLLSPRRPGDWNQAMMELGALVCVPRTPLCGRCPLAAHCPARLAGREREFPAAARRPDKVEVREVAAAALCGDDVLVLRRGPGGAFAGMWELPRLDDRTEDPGELIPETVLRRHTGIGGRGIGRWTPCGEARSVFTHHAIRTELSIVRLKRRPDVTLKSHVDHRWCPVSQLDALPASRAQRRLFALITSNLGSGEPT